MIVGVALGFLPAPGLASDDSTASRPRGFTWRDEMTRDLKHSDLTAFACEKLTKLGVSGLALGN